MKKNRMDESRKRGSLTRLPQANFQRLEIRK
jgi:hypothetical protein